MRTAMIAGLGTILGFGLLQPAPANAQGWHWFYDDYAPREERAWRDFDRRFEDDEDEVFFDDAPPPYFNRRERRKLIKRWFRRQQRRERNRRSLYEAWQNERYGVEPNPRRWRNDDTRRRPRKTITFKKVPVPKPKPDFLAEMTPPVDTDTSILPPANEKVARAPLPDLKKPPAAEPKAKPDTKNNVASLEPPRPKPLPRLKIKVTKPKSKNKVSCEKANSIVSEFGFSDVTASSCSGKVYSFKATRDGKPYSVKVSGLNGEVVDVSKQ